jgi:hypothetical protein
LSLRLLRGASSFTLLFSLCLLLFLLKFASLLFCLAISFRGFARQAINLLSACDVVGLTGTDRLLAPIVTHLKLLSFRLVRNALNFQRSSEVSSATPPDWILVHKHRSLRKFLGDAWWQVLLAASPG